MPASRVPSPGSGPRSPPAYYSFVERNIICFPRARNVVNIFNTFNETILLFSGCGGVSLEYFQMCPFSGLLSGPRWGGNGVNYIYFLLFLMPSCISLLWLGSLEKMLSVVFFILNSKNPFLYWELTHFGDLLPAADMVDALLLTALTSGFSPQRTVQLSELIL